MGGATVRGGEVVGAAVWKGKLSRAQLQIYEVGNAPGEGATGGTLLFDSVASGAATAPDPAEFSGYAVTHRLAVADRAWRLPGASRKGPVHPPDQAGARRLPRA